MILYFCFWNEQVAAVALKIITTVDHPRIETIGIMIMIVLGGGRTTSIAAAAEVRPKRRCTEETGCKHLLFALIKSLHYLL